MAASPANTALVNEISVEKLTPFYAALLDPSQPIPPGVRFYAVKRTWNDLLGTIAAAVVCLIIGVLGLVSYYFFNKGQDITHGDYFGGLLIGGLIAIVVAAALLWSLRNKARIINAQHTDQPLRFGLFITPDGLLIRDELSFSLIERGAIVTVRNDGGKTVLIYHGPSGSTPQITLPTSLTGIDAESLFNAVQMWRQTV